MVVLVVLVEKARERNGGTWCFSFNSIKFLSWRRLLLSSVPVPENAGITIIILIIKNDLLLLLYFVTYLDAPEQLFSACTTAVVVIILVSSTSFLFLLLPSLLQGCCPSQSHAQLHHLHQRQLSTLNSQLQNLKDSIESSAPSAAPLLLTFTFLSH